LAFEFRPEDLTGSLVLELRTRHKLSRVQFSELAGFAGKSTARLSNIERNDSWKFGDREAVARVLNDLTGGRFDPRYHGSGAADGESSTPSRPVGDVVLVHDEDDDPLDLLADVTSPPAPSPARVAPVATPVVEPVARQLSVELPADGVYAMSNGENQTWKRCRRKWWLGWYNGLRLRNEELVGVRSTGNRVHKALAAWYVPEGQSRVDPRDALERTIVDDWTAIHAVALERDLSNEQQNQLAREFAESTNLERAMVEGYVQWLEETGVDAELRVVASETPVVADVEVPRVHGPYRVLTDVPVRLIGLLDTRVYRVTDQRRLFLDHKTVGDLSAPAPTLPQNEQMLHYDLLEFLASDEGEQRCDGALYNMLRRVKRSTRAKPPFYGRIEVHHNVAELESYKRRLLASTADVLAAIERLQNGESHLDVVYPTPKSDCRWDCDFFSICNMFDDGSPGLGDMIERFYRRADPRDRYERADGGAA